MEHPYVRLVCKDTSFFAKDAVKHGTTTCNITTSRYESCSQKSFVWMKTGYARVLSLSLCNAINPVSWSNCQLTPPSKPTTTPQWVWSFGGALKARTVLEQRGMLSGLDPIWQSLLGTLFTWGLTAAGAGMVFVFQGGQVNLIAGLT